MTTAGNFHSPHGAPPLSSPVRTHRLALLDPTHPILVLLLLPSSSAATTAYVDHQSFLRASRGVLSNNCVPAPRAQALPTWATANISAVDAAMQQFKLYGAPTAPALRGGAIVSFENGAEVMSQSWQTSQPLLV